MKTMLPLAFKEEYSGNSLKVNLGWAAVFLGCGLGIAASRQFFPTDATSQMAAMIIALLFLGVGYGRMLVRGISRPAWQFVGIISAASLAVGFVIAMTFGASH